MSSKGQRLSTTLAQQTHLKERVEAAYNGHRRRLRDNNMSDAASVELRELRAKAKEIRDRIEEVEERLSEEAESRMGHLANKKRDVLAKVLFAEPMEALASVEQFEKEMAGG